MPRESTLTEVRAVHIAGRSELTGEVREIRSPWDGSTVSRVAWGDTARVHGALAAASEAREAMAALPAHRRSEILEAAREGVRARRDELVEVVVGEAGKPISAARAEVERALDTFAEASWAARASPGWVEALDAVQAGAGRFGVVRRVPVGVVAGITPFNFPVNLVAHKLAPAVAAGCPIVLKPAPEAPSAALLLGEILTAAGVPEGGVSVIPCDVPAAEALVGDPRVAVVSFTGSARVGWSLKARAGKARVALELGGNAGAYVAEDADLALAVERSVWGGFANAGQTCIHLQRILVHESRYEAFLEAFVDRVRRTVVSGDPREPAVTVGPLIRAADAERVEAWIAEAEAGGARTLTGGARRGQLVAPTVLVNTPASCALETEEVFGPVVTVAPVSSDDEALARLDRTRYGLQAAVFTRSVGLVMRAWRQLHVGCVVHDDAPSFRADGMPYGGVRDSGMGREGPRHALLELTEPRLLVVRDPA
jgi:glyceraldehyde-3-phosphate dehydrogenase (NADP+)